MTDRYHEIDNITSLESAPKDSTLSFIRQFARTYSYIGGIAAGIIIN